MSTLTRAAAVAMTAAVLMAPAALSVASASPQTECAALSAEARRMCEKRLERQAERQQTVDEVKKGATDSPPAVTRVVPTGTQGPTNEELKDRARTKSLRNTLILGVVVVAGLLIVGVGGTAWSRWREQQQQRELAAARAAQSAAQPEPVYEYPAAEQPAYAEQTPPPMPDYGAYNTDTGFAGDASSQPQAVPNRDQSRSRFDDLI